MSSRSRSAEPADEAIAVGRVLRAHGIRGELRVETWSDVDDRFTAGVELEVRPTSASGLPPRRLRIAAARADRGARLIRFDGVADRDAAEALRGAVLAVDPDEVPAAPDGFYYHFQLVGCRLDDRTAGPLGEVAEVIEDGGGHLLRVEDGRRSLLVPFVDAFLQRVDVDGRQIDVDLPPGLIETCTSKR